MSLRNGASTEQVLAPLPSPGSEWEVLTCLVLGEVLGHRREQVTQYGHNDDLETGMGPQVCWLLPYTTASAAEIEQTLRDDYEDFATDTGKPTWTHLIREEFAEAVTEADPVKREAEWIQVAALAVSFVESSRRARGAL